MITGNMPIITKPLHRLLILQRGTIQLLANVIAQVRQSNGTSAADGDQLSHDGDGDLLRHGRANLQANGSEDALEALPRSAFRLQLLKDSEHLAARADHSDVMRGRIQSPAENAHIVAVAASDDDDIGGGAGRQFREN